MKFMLLTGSPNDIASMMIDAVNLPMLLLERGADDDLIDTSPINVIMLARYPDMALLAFGTGRDYTDFETLHDCRDDIIHELIS